MPPINNTNDIKASYGVLSTATYPLAESGYYVYPVALVEQTFKENGLNVANDIHQVSTKKLAEIFGADAALYISVEKYGSVYTVINSDVVVAVKATLIDLKSSKKIWSGEARASSNEQSNNNNQGGLVGMLLSAVVKQIVSNATDASRNIGAIANNRLLYAQPNGLLYGPRSPQFGKDGK